MPARLPRACVRPGCPQPAVSRNRCAQHADGDPLQIARVRATAYNTRRWRRLRAAYLAAHPFCTGRGCSRLADVVDHLQPHRGDLERFWAGPFAALCRSCHGLKTAAESWGAR